ncbi:MAG: hypothetical protein JO222_15750, partial [Frankiales bacterium]|nr:hypothetical protein [Frankiales bacterium]
GLDMFAKAAPPPAQVLDDLAGLAAAGVTWATVTLPGDNRRDLLAEIDRFGSDVLTPLG